MVRGVASIERSDARALEGRSVRHSSAIRLAEIRMSSEQAETNQQVRFASAHRLLQMKHCLRRSTRQSRVALCNQVLHALSDEGLLKELRPIALSRDQLIQLFDLVAQLDRQRDMLRTGAVACRYAA